MWGRETKSRSPSTGWASYHDAPGTRFAASAGGSMESERSNQLGLAGSHLVAQMREWEAGRRKAAGSQDRATAAASPACAMPGEPETPQPLLRSGAEIPFS